MKTAVKTDLGRIRKLIFWPQRRAAGCISRVACVSLDASLFELTDPITIRCEATLLDTLETPWPRPREDETVRSKQRGNTPKQNLNVCRLGSVVGSR